MALTSKPRNLSLAARAPGVVLTWEAPSVINPAFPVLEYIIYIRREPASLPGSESVVYFPGTELSGEIPFRSSLCPPDSFAWPLLANGAYSFDIAARNAAGVSPRYSAGGTPTLLIVPVPCGGCVDSPTTPGDVRNFTATTGPNSIVLAWDDPACSGNPRQSPAALSYDLYWRKYNEAFDMYSGWRPLASNVSGNSFKWKPTSQQLTPGSTETIEFDIRARNGTRVGRLLSLTSNPQLPFAAQTIVVRPIAENITAVPVFASTFTGVRVSWSVYGENPQYPVTHYEIKVARIFFTATASGNRSTEQYEYVREFTVQRSALETLGGTFFIDIPLDMPTRYHFYIQPIVASANNLKGGWASVPNSLSGMRLPAPTSVVAQSTDPYSVNLSWSWSPPWRGNTIPSGYKSIFFRILARPADAEPGTPYRICGTVSISDRTARLFGLFPGSYTFFVRAVGADPELVESASSAPTQPVSIKISNIGNPVRQARWLPANNSAVLMWREPVQDANRTVMNGTVRNLGSWIVLLEVANTQNLVAGMLVFGPGVPVNSVIASIQSATAVQISTMYQLPTNNATGRMFFVAPDVEITRSSPIPGAVAGTTVTLPSTDGLSAGMLVFGPAFVSTGATERIAPNTLIVSVDSPTQITTNGFVPLTQCADCTMRFVRPDMSVLGTSVVGSNVVTLSSVARLAVGDFIFGPGIQHNTTITFISQQPTGGKWLVTLSAPAVARLHSNAPPGAGSGTFHFLRPKTTGLPTSYGIYRRDTPPTDASAIRGYTELARVPAVSANPNGRYFYQIKNVSSGSSYDFCVVPFYGNTIGRVNRNFSGVVPQPLFDREKIVPNTAGKKLATFVPGLSMWNDIVAFPGEVFAAAREAFGNSWNGIFCSNFTTVNDASLFWAATCEQILIDGPLGPFTYSFNLTFNTAKYNGGSSGLDAHELGHALGLGFWNYTLCNEKPFLADSPTAVNMYNIYIRQMNRVAASDNVVRTMIPLLDNPEPGAFAAHWANIDSSCDGIKYPNVRTDVMSYPTSNSGYGGATIVSLGYLADIGWAVIPTDATNFNVFSNVIWNSAMQQAEPQMRSKLKFVPFAEPKILFETPEGSAVKLVKKIIGTIAFDNTET